MLEYSRMFLRCGLAYLYITTNDSKLHSNPEDVARNMWILVSTHLGQMLARHHTKLGREQLLKGRYHSKPFQLNLDAIIVKFRSD